MKLSEKYDGTHIIEARHYSGFSRRWTPWYMCASRGTLKVAERELSKMVAEKTSIKQEFRLLNPRGVVIKEADNVKNLLGNRS